MSVIIQGKVKITFKNCIFPWVRLVCMLPAVNTFYKKKAIDISGDALLVELLNRLIWLLALRIGKSYDKVVAIVSLLNGQ